MNFDKTTSATSVSISLRNDLDRKSFTDIQIVSLSAAGRLKRAIKVLLICWLVAAVCILIPGFHFVLVPGGLIVGIVLFFREMRLQQLLLEGTICCPSCQVSYQAKSTAFNWPKYDRCNGCRSELIIEKRDANDNVRK